MPPLTRHRVLVTGFGPFRHFKINPSWLAAEQLHSNVLFTNDGPKPESIEITSIQVPVVYQDVLQIVPGLHASPPVLPGEFADRASDDPYSLIVHIGVARAGPLRFERLGHKTGYNMPDHENKMADIVDASCSPALRGFAASKYLALPEELTTSVDAVAIVNKLAKQGVLIRSSVDAGHYLCDFIYYCSLAESRLAGKGTPVIFIHCPPIGQPLTTDQVAAGVRDIIVSACFAMQ
ncbi:peptidase C15, pyroglutamyl peptidase I-like protein [Hymenopellis radicata]|nr:peptidase C15, pyroglutamyl peptidase I-like protein [Hymenopellis radicata]